jgi:hypothetical protein
VFACLKQTRNGRTRRNLAGADAEKGRRRAVVPVAPRCGSWSWTESSSTTHTLDTVARADDGDGREGSGRTAAVALCPGSGEGRRGEAREGRGEE